MSSFDGSRFANPNRTDVLSLGACRCPGTPHVQDEYVHRVELGAGEEQRAGDAGWAEGGYVSFSSAAAQNKLIEIGGVRWNLLSDDVDEKGNHIPMPLTAASAALLDEETRDLIVERLDAITERKPLPKASGGRSPRSPRANGSRARRARTKR